MTGTRQRPGDMTGPTLAALAVALAAAAAWRATLGISMFDDGQYASLTLRLAQGARPFADEMTTQALGFLFAAPFARLWTALLGTTGLVLALRWFFVVVAAGAAYAIFRALRPTFGAAPSMLAAVAPLLAPPYNILGLSYNTMAMLGFMLACALGLAAVRDSSPRAAALAGVAAAVAGISYLPLSVGTAVFLAAFALVARDRRLVLWSLAGAGATAALFAVWLLAVVSPSQIRAALAYSSEVLAGHRDPGERVRLVYDAVRVSVTSPYALPMWLLAVSASLSRVPGRLRALAAAAIPVAAAVPGVVQLTDDDPRLVFGMLGAAYVIYLALGLVAPVVAWAARGRDAAPGWSRDVLRLLALALPVGIVDMLLVAYFTTAGWHWGVPAGGAAPLVMALVAAWALWIQDEAGALALASAAAGLVTILVVLLFSTSFKDGAPLALDTRVTSGACAGVVTSRDRARRIAAIEDAGRRWVPQGGRVLFVGGPLGYVLVDARMATNAVWLAVGPTDRATLDYYQRGGAYPDAAFVASSMLEREGAAGTDRATQPMRYDPLLGYLEREYRSIEETAAGFFVYVPR
jgi:hypothetical protein